jgi:uncharacterized protein YcbK (DUF882 family)
MNPKRRDLLLAAGLTLVFGTSASARILVEGNMDALRPPSKPRRLTLRHAHTGETFSGPFRDHVGPLPDAMIDLSYFLRDHREDVRGPMYVATLDFLADVIEESGLSGATVLSAYRTPGTNAKLATKYFGVAEKSQHLAGRAIDITLDRRLEKTAGLAKTMSRGGVGWYPQSHFIHLDSGPVRSWTVDNSLLARGGKQSRPDETAVAGFLEKKPKRPLSVTERMKLHKALAKKQARPG